MAAKENDGGNIDKKKKKDGPGKAHKKLEETMTGMDLKNIVQNSEQSPVRSGSGIDGGQNPDR